MGNYIAIDKKKMVVDYLRDFGIIPPYYAMRKDYILEYSWERFAIREIEYRLYHEPGSEMDIIKRFINEMDDCYRIARRKKSIAGECMFDTALAVGREIESLLRASE